MTLRIRSSRGGNLCLHFVICLAFSQRKAIVLGLTSNQSPFSELHYADNAYSRWTLLFTQRVRWK